MSDGAPGWFRWELSLDIWFEVCIIEVYSSTIYVVALINGVYRIEISDRNSCGCSGEY